MLFNKHIAIVSVLLLIFALSCDDYSELEEDPIASGEADFSTYVAVGNSLTAGFQSNALYESAQEFSYPNLLARQFQGVEQFTQPLISDPGIGGRIELTSLNPLGTTTNQEQGQPINQDAKPFKNLGVPAAVLVDYANPNNSGMLKERATNPSNPSFNPFYGIVLEESELAKSAPNIHNQVAKQEPTFITFWLGNNDVLGFVTSGGEGQGITPPSQFAQLYRASAGLLELTGANVVVYNIPSVTSIPFVFLLRSQLEQQGTIRFNDDTGTYQLAITSGENTQYANIYIETDNGSRVMRQFDFITLRAQTYFGQIQAGQQTPPIDLNGDGIPESTIPDNLILDGPAGGPQGSSELEQAAGAVDRYNVSIKTIAFSSGFALVDVKGIFSQIISNFQSNPESGGYQTDGLTLQPIPGSLFSFDGVHISNRGAAVVANESIKVINEYYGADVERIDVSDIPQGLPVVSE